MNDYAGAYELYGKNKKGRRKMSGKRQQGNNGRKTEGTKNRVERATERIILKKKFLSLRSLCVFSPTLDLIPRPAEGWTLGRKPGIAAHA